jgi:hypothetical protein
MVSDWREGFRAAVTTVVMARGRPASSHDPDDYQSWVYGTYHDQYREILAHAKRCAFSPSGAVEAVEWSAFTDTEAPNENKHGLYVVASCACGLYTDVTWLYEADLGDLVNDLLAAVKS